MGPEKRTTKRVKKPSSRRAPVNEHLIQAEKIRQDRMEEVRALFRLPADDLIQLIVEEVVTAKENGESGKPFDATLHMGMAALIGSVLVMAQLQEMQTSPGDSSSSSPSD